MPMVHFQSPFDDVTVEVPEGTTLLEAAEKAGAHVGHSCGGVCACSTCHVYVKQGGESLSEQDDPEMDRLDMAFDVRPNSRLSCQAIVGKEDVEVQVSEESVTAYLDENPGERHRLEAEGKWPIKK
ncbi:MAG: 2Fe-2S iron-sulfur cluster binding domain-containing protein [Myxococcaceae bacterium]|nr:2Fe-2S iron-sulfur cluster binding domain-containing protein [Myxococcaceae bacterium]